LPPEQRRIKKHFGGGREGKKKKNERILKTHPEGRLGSRIGRLIAQAFMGMKKRCENHHHGRKKGEQQIFLRSRCRKEVASKRGIAHKNIRRGAMKLRIQESITHLGETPKDRASTGKVRSMI